jgi:hypothetical protein
MKLSDLKTYKIVGSAENPTNAVPQKDLLTKATDVATAIFPGTRAIGESLGTAALNIGKLAKGQNPDIPVDNGRAIGGYISAGAQVGGFGGVGTTGGILSKALQSAGIGAAISGGTELSKGSNLQDIAKSTAIGAGIGAGTSLAISGVEGALSGIKQLPERLVRSATGQSKKEILAGKDISKYVIENKRIGTADQLLSSSQKAIDDANSYINDALLSVKSADVSAAQKTITRHLQSANQLLERGVKESSLVSRLKENIVSGLAGEGQNIASDVVKNIDIASFPTINTFVDAAHGAVSNAGRAPIKSIISDIASAVNNAGGDVTEASITETLQRLAPQVKKIINSDTLSLTEANKLRSQLDAILKPSAFISNQLPFDRGILMDFSNALREQVKGIAPAGVRGAFNTLSKEITLHKLILSKVAGQSRNQVIGLGDLISGGFGGAVGGIPGAVVAAGAKRVAESPLTKTAAAVGIDALDRVLSPVLQNLEPATQTAIINAITQAVSESQLRPQ